MPPSINIVRQNFWQCTLIGWIIVFSLHNNNFNFTGLMTLVVLKDSDKEGFVFICQLNGYPLSSPFVIRSPNGTVGQCGAPSPGEQGLCHSTIGTGIIQNIQEAAFTIIATPYYFLFSKLSGNWTCEHGNDSASVYHSATLPGKITCYMTQNFIFIYMYMEED